MAPKRERPVDHWLQCDETRPACKRCLRKRLECAYSSKERFIHSTLDSIASCSSRTNTGVSKPARFRSLRSCPNQSASSTAKLKHDTGVSDVELAQHYLTHVVDTFKAASMRKELMDAWQVFIPALALTSQVVRHGMLTLAAINLHHEAAGASDRNASRSWKYLEAAEAHGVIFVEESRKKLQGLRASEVEFDDSILACARLLCVLGFAFFRAHRSNGVTLAHPAAWTWLHLLRGVETAYAASLQSGRDTNKVIVNDMIPELPTASNPCDAAPDTEPSCCKHPCYAFFQHSRRERLGALRNTLRSTWPCLGEEKTSHLSAAIDILDEITEHVCSKEGHSLSRAIFTWPGRIPKGFVDLLMSSCPPALAVYAHWLMLVILVEDFWWIGDMGRAGIRDVIAMCSDASAHVRALLIWPQLMLDSS